MEENFEMLTGFFAGFKLLSQFIIELIRKDDSQMKKIPGAGIGGEFLFPIKMGKNPYINFWAMTANILHYTTIIIMLVYLNTRK